MKNKIVLFLLVVVASINIYAEGFSVKGGLQINQSLEEEFLGDSDSFDIDSGYNLGLSYDFKVSKGWDIGVGTDIISKTLENNGYNTGISIHPIYGQFKYNFNRTNQNNLYIITKLGHPIFLKNNNTFDDINGDVYTGIGCGIEIGKFIVELLVDNSGADEKFYYSNGIYAGTGILNASRLNLSFGYNFGRKFSYSPDNTVTSNSSINYNTNSNKNIQDRITELNNLKNSGQISEEEYQEARKNILNSL